MEYPIYGLTREGLARPDTNIYLKFQDTITTRWLGQKAYELTDQLGNVRATISDIKLPISTAGTSPYKADFLSYMNPYPFGMPQPGRFWEAKVYRYGYNGKERDDEIKGAGESYDYGFRMLDPRVGRLLSVDPLTGEYPWYSPYQFAGNMPTAMVDRDGLEPARPNAAYTEPTETGGDASADQGSVEQSQRTVKSDVSRVTPVSMRALAIQQSRESIAPATPVEDDRSFGSGVWTGVLGFVVKTGLTFTSPRGWDQMLSAPVTLAKAGYQAALHPVQTYDAVTRAFTKFYNSSSYHKGEVFGEILGAVGLIGATGGAGSEIAVGEGAVEIAPEAAELTAELAPVIEAMQPAETIPTVLPDAPAATNAATTISDVATRPLTSTDLGIEGNLERLDGTFAVQNRIAMVRVDMIQGTIRNPLQIVKNLSELAKAHGANVLRIEATLANEQLYKILSARYGMVSEGGKDVIVLQVK